MDEFIPTRQNNIWKYVYVQSFFSSFTYSKDNRQICQSRTHHLLVDRSDRLASCFVYIANIKLNTKELDDEPVKLSLWSFRFEAFNFISNIFVQFLQLFLMFPFLFNFSYETSDGVARQEEAELKNAGTDHAALAVRGTVSWVAADGQQYTLNYVADENGYRPEGAHLPKA